MSLVLGCHLVVQGWVLYMPPALTKVCWCCPACSFISKDTMDRSLYFEVKDWDRVGRNELVGCMCISVQEIIGEKTVDSWFKLLESRVGKEKYQKIVVEEKVAEELIEEALVRDRKTIRRRKITTAEGSEALPKMCLQDFHLRVVLGKGSFGKVSVCGCLALLAVGYYGNPLPPGVPG